MNGTAVTTTALRLHRGFFGLRPLNDAYFSVLSLLPVVSLHDGRGAPLPYVVDLSAYVNVGLRLNLPHNGKVKPQPFAVM